MNYSKAKPSILFLITFLILTNLLFSNTECIYSYIDESAKIVIDAQYELAGAFKDNKAAVYKNDKWGWINKEGKYVLEPVYENIQEYRDTHALAAVRINQKWGLINKDGGFIIEPKFQKFIKNTNFDKHNNKENIAYATIKINDKWGLINKKGEYLIKPLFDQLYISGSSDDPGTLYEMFNTASNNNSTALVRIDGLWGIVDFSGKFLLEPTDKWIINFSEDLSGFYINNKYGFVNLDGHLVIKPVFEDIGKFSEGLAGAKLDGKWGFINKSGNFVIKPNYYEVSDFSEGLASAKKVKDGMWGVINNSGKIVFDYRLEYKSNFKNGETWNYIGDKKVKINSLGQIVEEKLLTSNTEANEKKSIETDFDHVGFFHEGLAAACKSRTRKTGFIDKTGQFVIAPQFFTASKFSEGLAAFKFEKDRNWGYIDKKGNIVIEPKLETANPFKEGLALAKKSSIENKEDLYGYINTRGNFTVQPKYNGGFDYSQGLAAVALNWKWGYIDSSGNNMIDHIYDKAYPFSEDLALVVLNGKQFFINKKGLKVFEPQCENCVTGKKFSSGLIKITIDKQHGYMDKTGRIVIKPQYTHTYDFSDGLASVMSLNPRDYNIYFIDPNGNIKLQFSSVIFKFSEGLAWTSYLEDTIPKIGYVDKTGKYKIKPMLISQPRNFSEGLAPVGVYLD